MRELKFRAWDDKKSLYVFNPIDIEFIARINNGHFEIDHYNWIIIEQFTGLEDKNGKDIYEGDILRGESHKGWNPTLKVNEWDNLGIVFWDQDCKFNVREISGSKWPHHWICWSKEIIGNIHQNPELLNGKETKE